jgi:hypothetical protein
MFGIGPTELALFLVIVLLAVGPEKLPAFMRTVGQALRQVRNASREFKEAIGLDELLRDGDPFRAPPIRPPRARPVPLADDTVTPPPEATSPSSAPSPEAAQAVEAAPSASATDQVERAPEADVSTEAKP